MTRMECIPSAYCLVSGRQVGYTKQTVIGNKDVPTGRTWSRVHLLKYLPSSVLQL